ncbi:2'-5' RNA ligase family protein [Solicola gregarius]|uniref:2'-5' RNA ligase family protein n=1 Tax=Solicola gregarius TaxID=2908642 RepID=A0AA46TES9_9ACTN|nr:2'-5' RNA ligase family protein [Solicola gregarius]UYM03910.1 2'-5' RNA ligase family protein [Solicola gregarius]
MTQSVELLLDDDADAGVRGEWSALQKAGLPSQGANPADTNRPHVTLWAGDALDPSDEGALAELASGLPMPLRLGALACFGRRRFVLVRFVVTSVPLLMLQASVARVCGVDPRSTLAPGQWTPHVTLARRLTAAEVGRAVDALGRAPERAAEAIGWRRWDGDARREWPLPTRSLS